MGAEEAITRPASAARRQGVARRWIVSRSASKRSAITIAMPPAMMIAVGKCEVRFGEDLGAEPAAVGEDGEGRDRDRADRRDPQAADDLRDRQRQLDLPEDLPLGQAHAAGGVLDRVGHVVEADRHVAVDDLQRVGGERDDRGLAAAPGDRQQQEEEGDAGDRVEDRRSPARSGGCSQRWRWARTASAKAIAKPISDRDHDQLELLQGRASRSGRCCSRRPVPAEEVAVLCLAGQRAPVRSWKNPSPTSPAAASDASTRRLSSCGRSAARVLVDLGLRRGEELGDDLDREHAGDAAVGGRSPARTETRPGAGRRARRA